MFCSRLIISTFKTTTTTTTATATATTLLSSSSLSTTGSLSFVKTPLSSLSYNRHNQDHIQSYLSRTKIIISRNMSSESENKQQQHETQEQQQSRKIKIYTRGGDKGTSSLFNGQRTSKTSEFFEALGDVDELNAQIGIACVQCTKDGNNQLADKLTDIQSRLFDIGAHLATPLSSSSASQIERMKFDQVTVDELERWIDEMDTELAPLRNFILPGGTLCSAHLHVARAVTRRAERHVFKLIERGDVDTVVGRYLNRLSDFLFVAARYSNHVASVPDVAWKKVKANNNNNNNNTNNSSDTSSSNNSKE